MEEKKLKTLQEEYRSLNQKYKKSEDSLAEHKEAKNKLEAKLKVVNDEVDRKIEEATCKSIQNWKLLMNLMLVSNMVSMPYPAVPVTLLYLAGSLLIHYWKL